MRMQTRTLLAAIQCGMREGPEGRRLTVDMSAYRIIAIMTGSGFAGMSIA